MVTYTTRNALHKPGSSDVDFPGEMEANTTILDAAVAKRYETATRPPTLTDDSSAGYSAGSWWQYTTGPVLYRCTSAAVGAAVWIQAWPIPALYVTNAMLAGSITNAKLAGSISDGNLATPYIKADGSRGLSAAWDAGSFQIRAETFQSDVATGAPLVVASTTKVTNLNADRLDDLEGSAYMVKSLIDAKGDIIVGTANDTPALLGIGTEGQNLIVQAAATPGMAWDSSRLDGWIAAVETWTYAATDAPSYTFTITGDKTTKYYQGMRIKLTDSTVKYFIITKSEYSSPNTTVTIYGGTDYTLSGGAITAPFYSMMKAPAGFPLNPAKWTETHSDTGDRTAANPTASTWYNVGTTNNQLSLPIGAWKATYLTIFQVNGATVADLHVTLSTANNSESNALTTRKVYFVSGTVYGFAAAGDDDFIVTAKTVLYLNAKTSGTITSGTLEFAGNQSPTTIKAVCAYL